MTTTGPRFLPELPAAARWEMVMEGKRAGADPALVDVVLACIDTGMGGSVGRNGLPTIDQRFG